MAEAGETRTGGSAGATSRRARVVAYAVAVACVAVLDQLVKAWILANLGPTERVTFIPGVLDLKLVHNTGAAFSMGEGAGPVFVCIAAAILVAGAVVAWREGELPVGLAAVMGCVAGGGVGNAIDRLLLGSVTDFFATSFMDFPVFNVADIFVTCGVVVGIVWFARWDDHREAG